MPRIADRFLDCVVYLYPTVESARLGEQIGGTGFFVGVPVPGIEDKAFMYVVTAAHCVRPGNSLVIRVNTVAGGVQFYVSKEEYWAFHPDGDDVAACYVGLVPDMHKHSFVMEPLFARRPEDFGEGKIDYAIGDDIFFLGRFVAHDGVQKNAPTVRFGNIAMLAEEPIVTTDGRRQESFLVEARSLPGYSGSPVFVYRSIPLPALGYSQGASLRLLGVDWCHLSTFTNVVGADRETAVDPTWAVEQNSGMMGVIPAWRISELLWDDALSTKREEMAAVMRERHAPDAAIAAEGLESVEE